MLLTIVLALQLAADVGAADQLQLLGAGAQLSTATPALPGVLVDRRLADAIGAGVGDSVQLRALGGDAPFRWYAVEGVFERAADPARIARNEFELRFHLPDLEELLPVRDRVDRFAIRLAPGASAERASRWVEELAFGTRAVDAAALADESSATFRVVSRFHRAIGIVTILASGIFLLCVMIIRVDERQKDAGMLRLIGVSQQTIFRTVVLEALGIAVLGSIAGAGLGAVVTLGVNRHYGALYDTSLRFALLTPRILTLAVVLGLVLGVSAGVLAALRLSKAPIERLGGR